MSYKISGDNLYTQISLGYLRNLIDSSLKVCLTILMRGVICMYIWIWSIIWRQNRTYDTHTTVYKIHTLAHMCGHNCSLAHTNQRTPRQKLWQLRQFGADFLQSAQCTCDCVLIDMYLYVCVCECLFVCMCVLVCAIVSAAHLLAKHSIHVRTCVYFVLVHCGGGFRSTDRRTYGQTDRQADRLTDRQTHTYTKVYPHVYVAHINLYTVNINAEICSCV